VPVKTACRNPVSFIKAKEDKEKRELSHFFMEGDKSKDMKKAVKHDKPALWWGRGGDR